jgi:hypothetical protein
MKLDKAIKVKFPMLRVCVSVRFIWLFISLSCICGMCSKNDDTANNSNNNTDSVLAPDATWVYFNDCTSLIYFYTNNNRPLKKWIATKINVGIAGYSGNNPHFLVWNFENTGDTRFLQNAGNSGGKESFTISIKNFNATPGRGSYQMDVDYKEGFCWYEVYNSSGALHDSTRTQSFSSSTFNITKMIFDRPNSSTIDRYKMTGNATFNIMYWQNGTSSTTDIHTLQCTFNNVPVDVSK